MATTVIPLSKDDTLARHGYVHTMDLTVAQRREALSSAIDELGATYVGRKLNVLYIFNRNRNPAQAAIFEADKQWVRQIRLVEAVRNVVANRRSTTNVLQAAAPGEA